MLSALLRSLVVLDVSLPSESLSFLSLGVAGSDLRLSLVVKLVFQGEELGGTAPGRGGEMEELESAGGRGEGVGGQGLGGGSGNALPLTCTARSVVTVGWAVCVGVVCVERSVVTVGWAVCIRVVCVERSVVTVGWAVCVGVVCVGQSTVAAGCLS